jgi:hypothetical protein
MEINEEKGSPDICSPLYVGFNKGSTMKNFMRVIAPYKHEGTWVFDDDSVGLVKEPFVFGADGMIEWLVGDIEQAEAGFLLYFSDKPFPGHQQKISWVREEDEGNWYQLEEPPMEGWLCPALFHYFDEAPQAIFVKAEPKKST